MKAPLKHMAWIWLLLISTLSGQSTYTVKPGDNLSKIARAHGCSVEALAKANGIKLSDVIQAGQSLKLPGRATAPAGDGSHTIQAGDTFSSVARKYGVPVATLVAANPGLDPRTLRVGQKIQLAAPAAPGGSALPQTAGTDSPSSPSPSSGQAAPAPEIPASPADETAPVPSQGKIRTVMVDEEMTYEEFALKFGTNVQRLNELNGLDLTSATVLAKGSELYVPSQP
jgi:LysM repeat protein